MAKKKIVIFGIKYFPSKGGASRVVENLLTELTDYYDFTIYCYKNEKAANYMPGVKTIQFSETKIKGLGVFIYYFKCFFHLMFNGQYDLVHLHKTDAAFFLPLLSRKFKVVSTSHALPQLNDKWSGIGKTYFRFVERLFVSSNSTLTAVARTQTAYYKATYNRDVNYIPNGIHPVDNVDPRLADDILAEHNISPNYLFFAARRLIPLKGCHHLIEALKLIDYKGTLVIAADIEQLPSYTESIKKAAKGLDVKFLGYVGNMNVLNALIKQAQLFIFPSELEGMSMMLLEVGSVGTPMVCSNIPQNTAVLGEEEVLYFQTEDAKDLSRKLQWAFNHSKEMTVMADRVKNTVEKEYTVSVVVKKYMDLYNSILEPSFSKTT